MLLRHRVYHIFISTILGILLVLTGCKKTTDQNKSTISLSPQVQQLLANAQNSYRLNDYLTTLTVLNQLQNIAPELPAVYFLQGRVFTKLKRYQKAQQAYEEVLQLDPHYRWAHFNLGNNWYRQAKWSKAIEHYEKEIQFNPDADVYVNMGRTYAKWGKSTQAKNSYHLAIEADTTYAESYYRLAKLLSEEGEYREALRIAQNAVIYDHDDKEYEYLLGNILVALGQNEQAIPYLKSVIQSQPWHQRAYYNLGMALIRTGRTQQGEDYLDKAQMFQETYQQIDDLEIQTETHPNSFMHWINLGDKLRETGRLNRALEAYQAALFLEPQNLALQNNVANLYLSTGDTLSAIRRYQAILQYDPTLIDVWLNLGVVYANTGQLENAKEAWNTVLKYQPDNTTAQRYKSRLSEMQ